MAKQTGLYDTLEISPEATESEIKKAFRLMALKWHPDKNNHSQESTEKFQHITKAYEVLMDGRQRAIYDRYGEEGLTSSGPSLDPSATTSAFSMKSEDLFTQFFSEGFFDAAFEHPVGGLDGFRIPTNNPVHVRKNPDIRHKLTCTLEELYTGKTTKLGLSRTVLCQTCNARGGLNINTCEQCQGRGRVLIQKRSGLVIQRFESTCRACNGSGEIMDMKDRCTTCHGAKTVEEHKILMLEIPPGTKNGEQIKLECEGDQGLGVIPGDVIVTIEELKHSTFKRKGSHLYYRAKIDLLTALVGGSFTVPHLSGETLKVDIIPGEIIKPNTLKVVKECGMPSKHRSYGDLLIYFEVEFPDKNQLNEESVQLLAKALPERAPLNIPQGTVPMEKVLSDYDPLEHSYKSKRDTFRNNFKRRKKSQFSSSTDSNSSQEPEPMNGQSHPECTSQ